jgi:hypothetical protein
MRAAEISIRLPHTVHFERSIESSEAQTGQRNTKEWLINRELYLFETKRTWEKFKVN